MSIMPIKFNFTIQEYYDKGLIKPHEIQILREYLENEGMPHDSDEMIAVYVLGCANNLEDAKIYARIHYLGRKAVPEVFANRDLKNEKLRREWDIMEMSVMPTRTDKGYAVIVFRFFDPVASHLHMDLTVKLVLMTIDSILCDEPVPGFVIVVDLEKMSLMHFTRLNFSILKRMCKFASEGLLCHLKGIHYINGGFVMDKLFKLFKAFCKPELLELFHYYSSNMVWEDFYENAVPKKCLPSDYGGDLDSMKELHQKMWQKFEEQAQFFEDEYNHRLPYEQCKNNSK